MKTKPGYNQEVLNIMKNRHGYSLDFIRKSIRGDRASITSNMLRAEYHELNNEAKKAIENMLINYQSKPSNT
jgi:hypothetical protein